MRTESIATKSHDLQSLCRRIDELLSRESDHRTLMDEACRILLDAAGSELAWIGVVDPDTGDLRPLACCARGELPGLEDDEADSTLGRVLLREAQEIDGAVVLTDADDTVGTTSWRAPARRAGLRSAAAVPVAAAGRLEGALALCARAPDAYGPEQKRLLESVAAHLGMAMRAYRLELEYERQAETLRRRGRELDERVKELDCLISLSRLVDCPDIDLPTLCRETVRLLPPSWQYPEITCARLRIDGDQYCTPGFRETGWRLSAELREGGRRLGAIDVFYTEERPAADEGPFQAEERQLLDAVAERLGKMLVAIRTQAALEASEARHRRVFEGVPVGLYSTTPEGRVLDANPELVRMLRYPDLEAFRSADVGVLYVDPEEREAWKRDAQESGEVAGRVVAIRRRDGSVARVRHSARVVRDEDGEVVAYEGAAEDVTEQWELQQRLEEQNALLDQIMEVLPVGVLVTDPEGRTRRTNPAAREVWGGERAVGPESYGEYKGWWYATGEPVAAEDWALARAVRNQEISVDEEVEIECFDGAHKVILDSAVPLFGPEGDLLGAISVNHDITRRTRAEEELADLAAELRRSNEELEQFAYVASHDLQEPLRMVVSYLELLERRLGDALEEDHRRYFDYAVDGGKRMQRLISDLLSYSRVGTRGNPFEPVELGSVLEEACRDLTTSIEESNAEITSDALPTVTVDAWQMQLVLHNLVGNAIKFRDRERPRIHVGAEATEGGWRISVRDNGIGIAPEHRERIFEIFQRLHGRGEYPGTGLGLALCRRIVRRHGGEIDVDSVPGEGATFHFTIPHPEEAPHAD